MTSPCVNYVMMLLLVLLIIIGTVGIDAGIAFVVGYLIGLFGLTILDHLFHKWKK